MSETYSPNTTHASTWLIEGSPSFWLKLKVVEWTKYTENTIIKPCTYTTPGICRGRPPSLPHLKWWYTKLRRKLKTNHTKSLLLVGYSSAIFGWNETYITNMVWTLSVCVTCMLHASQKNSKSSNQDSPQSGHVNIQGKTGKAGMLTLRERRMRAEMITVFRAMKEVEIDWDNLLIPCARFNSGASKETNKDSLLEGHHKKALCLHAMNSETALTQNKHLNELKVR